MLQHVLSKDLNRFINIKQYTTPFSLPPELSLEFICGTVTSEACMLVTDAAVTAGAGLLLLKRKVKLWCYMICLSSHYTHGQ